MLRFLIFLLLPFPAMAQQFQPAGLWYCTVNARSNDPSGNYGMEVEMMVQPDGSLQARGNVFYPQLARSVQPVEGYGDWTVLPPEGGQGPLIKYRMHTSTHGILTWFVRPTGPGSMYNMFQHQDPQTGLMAQVETQCGRTG